MTAQNMGKKILTDAGYDVIAVSNGAAAIKKIAEHKPDIIILDVYMPGYTGLEVCEKVRASIETLKTPVLLTVGKMEPYRAEDANRVKADGVIIKPFEASALIAIVKKLEERVIHKAEPLADQTIMLDRPPDFSQFAPVSAVEMPVTAAQNSEHNGNTMQATVDVPDHMATTSAFSDLLGPEPMHTLAPFPVSAPMPVEFHPVSELQAETQSKSVPEMEVVPSFTNIPLHTNANAAAAPAPALEINMVHSSGAVEIEPADDTQPLTAYAEAQVEEAAPARRESGFEPTIADKVEVPASVDPGLLPDSAALESFPTKFGVENAEEIPVGIASDLPELGPVVVGPETALQVDNELQHAHVSEVTEDDFEARVAAAMAAYDEAAEMEVAPEALPGPGPQMEIPPDLHVEAETPVSFEYVPPVTAPQSEMGPEPQPVQQAAQGQHEEVEAVQHHPVEALGPVSSVVPVYHESEPPTALIARQIFAEAQTAQAKTEEEIVAGIEVEMPMAAAASESETDHHQVIAEIVHRVMERFKPELIAEIVRELNSRK